MILYCSPAKKIVIRFLLAKLHMDSLSSKLTPGDINIALRDLRHLPQGTVGLGLMYEQAMKRVNGQDEDCQRLAHNILSWITQAKRPLTSSELQHALAVRVGFVDLDEGFVPEIEDMISVCAGLVTIDKSTNIVRWIHYTTQEFFEKTWETWLPNAQLQIATSCIVYISYERFAFRGALDGKEWDLHLLDNPFYLYAARYWGYHACSVNCTRYVIQFPELISSRSSEKKNRSIEHLEKIAYIPYANVLLVPPKPFNNSTKLSSIFSLIRTNFPYSENITRTVQRSTFL
jgi:hypothetical protein